MTRKKLNFIPKDSMRKATFNQRKKGIMKKMHELTVLCDIEACAVIRSSFTPTPEVWPSVSGVNNVVERFHMLPEMDQVKKMVNHGTFLQQSIDKIKENNTKRMKDNAERTLKEAMFEFLAGKGDTLEMTDKNRVDLIQYIDQYLKELYHRRDHTLNQPRLEHGESSSSANIVMAPRPTKEVGSSSLAPRATTELGSSSKTPKPLVEEGSFSLAPRVIAEVSSLAFQHKHEQVNPIAHNFLPNLSDQQYYYLMMNQIGVYDQQQGFNLNQYQYQQQDQQIYRQQFGYPSFMGQDGVYHMNPPLMGQDGMYNPNQSQNQLGEPSMDQTMDTVEQMGFHTMDDNNDHYHQQI